MQTLSLEQHEKKKKKKKKTDSEEKNKPKPLLAGAPALWAVADALRARDQAAVHRVL
jgi:hypothetical protein